MLHQSGCGVHEGSTEMSHQRWVQFAVMLAAMALVLLQGVTGG